MRQMLIRRLRVRRMKMVRRMSPHPSLWLLGEVPRVAEEDFLLPGSYRGFT